MDRMQELNNILHDPTPPALEQSVKRAKARYNKSRVGRWCGIPVISLAGVAAAFVLLVNTSIPFARACGNIPFLKELAATVALSPTLKAAVENDFVQYVGETKEVDGVPLTVEYLIFDRSQVNVFFTIGGPTGKTYNLCAELLDGTESALNSSFSSTVQFTSGKGLEQFTFSFPDPQPLPEEIALRFGFGRMGGQLAFPESVTFDIKISPGFTALQEHVELNRWFELDGQRLCVESMDIYPLSTTITLKEDPGNTAALSGLELNLVDEKGVRYGQGNGSLLASGDLTYYLGSSYLARSEHLTLEIAGVEWLDKGAERTTIHFGTQEAEHMPLGAQLNSLLRFKGNVTLEIRYVGTGSLFSWTYYDPEGGEHLLESGTSSSIDRDGDGYCEETTDYIFLKDYPWDSVTLLPRWSRTVTFDTPVTVALK